MFETFFETVLFAMQTAVYFAVAAVVLLVLAVFVFGLYRAAQAFGRGNAGLAAAWIVIAFSPAIFYVVWNTAADRGVDKRQASLSQMSRATLTSNHPRTLEVHGYMQPTDYAALIAAGHFDTVVQFQDTRRAEAEVFEARSGGDCDGAASRWLSREQITGRVGYELEQTLKACVRKTTENMAANDRPRRAVVYLMGHATTLHRGNTLRGHAFELRLREDGKEALVDYSESRVVNKVASPVFVSSKAFVVDQQVSNPENVTRMSFLLRVLK